MIIKLKPIKKKFKGITEVQFIFSTILLVGTIGILMLFATQDLNVASPISGNVNTTNFTTSGNFSTSGQLNVGTLLSFLSFSSPYFWLSATLVLAISVTSVYIILRLLRGGG